MNHRADVAFMMLDKIIGQRERTECAPLDGMNFYRVPIGKREAKQWETIMTEALFASCDYSRSIVHLLDGEHCNDGISEACSIVHGALVEVKAITMQLADMSDICRMDRDNVRNALCTAAITIAKMSDYLEKNGYHPPDQFMGKCETRFSCADCDCEDCLRCFNCPVEKLKEDTDKAEDRKSILKNEIKRMRKKLQKHFDKEESL